MNELVKEFLQRIQNTKAINTYKTYSYILGYWFPDGEINITPAHVDRRLGEWRKTGTSTNTISHRLRVLNQFLRFLEDKEMKIPHIKELRSIIESVSISLKIPTIATRDQVDEIVAATKDKKYKAIVCLLFYGGLRVSEVVELDLEDFNQSNGQIIIRDPKNNDERIVRLEDVTVGLMKDYISSDRYNSSSALFTTHNGRISQNVVQRTVTKISKNVGYDLNCHAFRHGSATYLLDQGIDLRQIQDFLGHKSITTTQRYTHITNARKDDIKHAFKKKN